MRVLLKRAFLRAIQRFCLCLDVFTEGLVDCVKHFVHICEHLIVPKPEDSIVPGFKNEVRFSSSAERSACWEPSSSITRRRSIEKKSAKYGPIGCCRLNFAFRIRRPRRCRHNNRSASVCSRRNLRAFRCGDSSKGIVMNVCQLGIKNKIRGEQNLKSRAKDAR